ncbi:MAG: hypothetical protein HYV07_30835 [Deltaproteobacteria bacterium]|nr:hypothetical protein [Deltaproteobacteria bacterium]
MSKSRAPRILAVTAGLAVAGAIFGSIAVILAVGCMELVSAISANLRGTDYSSSNLHHVLTVGAVFGAPLGAVLAPVAGWALLRYVPLGKAFVGLTVGATIGGVVGVLVYQLGQVPVNPLISAVLGFVVAAVVLRKLHMPVKR